MGTDFSIIVDDSQTQPIIRITGEIDIYSCPQLNKTLNEIVAADHHTFTMDLESVQYIDSTGLGAIAGAARQVAAQDGHINVIANKPQIVKIFEISGLGQKNVSLYSSEDQVFGQ